MIFVAAINMKCIPQGAAVIPMSTAAFFLMRLISSTGAVVRSSEIPSGVHVCEVEEEGVTRRNKGVSRKR